MSKYQHRSAIALALLLAAAGIAAVVSGIPELKAVADSGTRACGGPLVPLQPHTQTSDAPVSSPKYAACEVSNPLDGLWRSQSAQMANTKSGT